MLALLCRPAAASSIFILAPCSAVSLVLSLVAAWWSVVKHATYEHCIANGESMQMQNMLHLPLASRLAICYLASACCVNQDLASCCFCKHRCQVSLCGHTTYRSVVNLSSHAMSTTCTPGTCALVLFFPAALCCDGWYKAIAATVAAPRRPSTFVFARTTISRPRPQTQQYDYCSTD